MNTNKSIVIAALMGLAVSAQQEGNCKALVLSGGGNNGAWEVGVLWGLAHKGNPEDFYYDMMTGVSAGAIATAAFAGFAKEDILEATEWVTNTFNGMTNASVYEEWPEGLIKSVLDGRPSILNDEPGIEYLTDKLSDPIFTGFKRDFSIAAQDIETNEYHQFTPDNVAFGSELAKAAFASASIPVVFPPMHF
jgi:predicted acylesterase/phospholipase RssA